MSKSLSVIEFLLNIFADSVLEKKAMLKFREKLQEIREI